jgi:protein-arginine kinase activator protein McsA
MAIFWKKKTDSTSNKEVRRCLNCGKDISDKRKDAKFCCNTCYQGYYNITKPF